MSKTANGRANVVWLDCDHCHYGFVRYLTEMANAGLPVRYMASTSIAIMDYNRSLRLAKIKAVGEGSHLASPFASHEVEVSRPIT